MFPRTLRVDPKLDYHPRLPASFQRLLKSQQTPERTMAGLPQSSAQESGQGRPLTLGLLTFTSIAGSGYSRHLTRAIDVGRGHATSARLTLAPVDPPKINP